MGFVFSCYMFVLAVCQCTDLRVVVVVVCVLIECIRS
jgi:hypothetical protein